MTLLAAAAGSVTQTTMSSSRRNGRIHERELILVVAGVWDTDALGDSLSPSLSLVSSCLVSNALPLVCCLSTGCLLPRTSTVEGCCLAKNGATF